MLVLPPPPLLYRQAVFIAILVKVEALPKEWKEYDVADVTEGLQNFIICVEMLLFALAHYFVFSHKPFVDPAAAKAPCIASCLRMLDVRDVADDVKEHFVDPIPRPKLPTITRRNKTKRGDTFETTPLIIGTPSLNSGPEHTAQLRTPRTNSEVSSEFSVVTYRDLDPRPAFGRTSQLPEEESPEQASRCSSEQDSPQNNSSTT